ncbi:cytochrome P450, partial [Bacillus licheniformis]|nr:cytochrome P450 [Bacillus licheniformis]
MLRLLLSSMVLKDPPEHRRLRNLVQKAFTPSRVAKLAGRVEEITDELLDAAAAKPVIELVGDLALPLPLTVIAEMLGVPPADRIRFRTLFASIQSNSQTTAVSLARNYRRMRELTTFLQELVRLRRDQPGDDLLSDLV